MQEFIMDHDLLITLRKALENHREYLEKFVNGEYNTFKYFSHEIMNIELLLRHFGSNEIIGDAIRATTQEAYDY